MRRIILILVVALGCGFVATPAQAQFLKWGFKGGVNLSELDVDEWRDKSWDSDNTTGFFIGPMAEVTIPLVGLGVDGALLFSQKGKHQWKQQGLEIPVNLKYTIGLGSLFGIYLAAGPDFFFNFKDNDWDKGVHKKYSQLSINLGAGLKLINHLQVGFTYQIPCSDSYRDDDHYTNKTKTWQIALAYLF